MVKQYYKVLRNFDSTKDYGIKIRPQYAKCLSILKRGQRINQQDFAKEFGSQFTHKNSQKSREEAVYHAFVIGKKIGILRPFTTQELGYSLSYEDFCKLETVTHFMKQHRGSKMKNLKPKTEGGTSGTYAYRLWKFNNWLTNKEIELTRIYQSDKDTFKKKSEKFKLKNIEDFLNLYQQPLSQEREFLRVIKNYLLDPINEDHAAKSMKVLTSAIKSYFEKNESPINLKFDVKARHKTIEEMDEQSSLDLSELMQLLTVGNPTLVQKAAFLCKFHRGLDTSTLIDRFNFEAWQQLVDYFGTENYKKWDLKLCPVPVFLTRIKTTFPHTGFLERDAVESVQKYLDYRKKQTGKEMTEDQPLFLTEKRKPITKEWVIGTMKKLRKNAGLDSKLSGYKSVRYKINPHEFRDLLKSILIDCNVRPDVCEHVIGHKPKDSYEKQAQLFQKTLRTEYSKASKRLNIFSNFSSMARGESNIDAINDRMNSMDTDIRKMKKRISKTGRLRRKGRR